MVEINDLYRVIDHDNAALHVRWLTLATLALIGGVLGRASISMFRQTGQWAVG